MDNTNVMIEFAELLKNNHNGAYDFICNNYHKMSKSEVVFVAKELIYSIYNNCFEPQAETLYKNVAVELEAEYRD